ncbi:hypothetical protein NEUTE2DRAFT_156278 [Neurospora tetrasperma FGSC 2509]|nr:hypothetical protein NEUTE2DRAFT_156278 [Neurospora tetrasperma FGSC 2509]
MSLDTYLATASFGALRASSSGEKVQFGYILESDVYLGFAFLAVEGNFQVDMPAMHTYYRRLGLNGPGPQRPDVSNTIAVIAVLCCRRSIARRTDRLCRFQISRTLFRSRTPELYTRFRFQIPEHLRKLHTGTCGEMAQKHRDHGLSGKPGIRDPTVPDGPGMLVQPKK